MEFLGKISKDTKQQTKRIRFSHLSAFFNFVRTNIIEDFQNPCDRPILRKMFKAKPIISWDIIEKDVIDEIIFRTEKPRNRLILELMARGGMNQNWSATATSRFATACRDPAGRDIPFWNPHRDCE